MSSSGYVSNPLFIILESLIIQHAYSYRFYDIDIMELELYENFAILAYARPNSIFYEIILLFNGSEETQKHAA